MLRTWGLCRTHTSERRVRRHTELRGEEDVMRALVGHTESWKAQAEQVTTSPSRSQEALVEKLAGEMPRFWQEARREVECSRGER